MAINIIDDEPDVTVTKDEYTKYRKEWEEVCMFNTDPPTLEQYIRSCQKGKKWTE